MQLDVVIFILTVAVLVGTGISILATTLKTRSPPAPSGPALRRRILEMTRSADIKPGPIYELGSGWGGLARSFAKAYPDRAVYGLEISPVPCWSAWLAKRLFGPANLHFSRCDFIGADLSGAAMIVCYLSGETLQSMAPSLEERLPNGSLILSATFAWPGRTPLAVTHAEDLYRSPVYLYRLD